MWVLCPGPHKGLGKGPVTVLSLGVVSEVGSLDK